MPKRLSSKHILRVLEENGFKFVSQKGSHVKYRKTIGHKTFNVIIPNKKRQIPAGTFSSILRQSNLNKEDF